MSEQIEPKSDVRDALGVVTSVLSAQALALNGVFFRAAAQALSREGGAHCHARKALRAQARCRATCKVLLALGVKEVRHADVSAEARRAEAESRPFGEAGDREEFSISHEQTIQTLKTTCIANSLLRKEAAPAPRARPPRKRSNPRKQWSAERRARQRKAIRSWQPWLKSSGPRTQDGKAHSARNALRHGYRSRAYLEMLQEDRGVLRDSACNLAIAKVILQTRSARAADARFRLAEGGLVRRSLGQTGLASPKLFSEGGSPNWYWPSQPRTGTFRPQILGNRGLSGLSPADNGVPRRRWRIARHDEEDVPHDQG